MRLLEKILLHQKLEIDHPSIFIRDKLSSCHDQDFYIEKVEDDQYKFVSEFSLGTLTGAAVDGIKIYGVLLPITDSKVDIILSTKIRIELKTLAVFELFFILFQIFGSYHIPLWSNLIFPLCIVWFWFVYRYQENNLLSSVTDYLSRL